MKIEGNELADSLARRAANEKPFKKHLYTTTSFLKQEVKESIVDAWSKDWTSQLLREEEGKIAIGLGKLYRAQSKCHIPNFKFKPFNMTNSSRKTQSAYIQARTGIGSHLAYMKKIVKSDTDICNYCNKNVQTIEHLILYCSSFKKQRRKEFKNISPLTLPILFNTNVGKTWLLRYLSKTGCFFLHQI